MESNRGRDDLQQQLREIERGESASWVVYPPTPVWWPLGFGVWAGVFALVIALPAGLAIGHTRRATWVVSLSNAIRAIPTVGLIVLLAVLISPHFHGRTDNGFLIPTQIVLILIAILTAL